MEGAAAMSTVGQIVRKNANGLLTTHPKESVFAALEIMAKHDIGALVVMDGGMLAGLFTERDYARKVILKGRSSRECSVGELMGDAVRVGPDCLVADALAAAGERGPLAPTAKSARGCARFTPRWSSSPSRATS